MGWYDKALVGHRFGDCLKAKRAVEKQLKEQERLAYLDPDKALEAKIADIEHNGDLSRVTDKDLDQNSEYIGRRSMKYAKARRLLTGGNVGF